MKKLTLIPLTLLSLLAFASPVFAATATDKQANNPGCNFKAPVTVETTKVTSTINASSVTKCQKNHNLTNAVKILEVTKDGNKKSITTTEVALNTVTTPAAAKLNSASVSFTCTVGKRYIAVATATIGKNTKRTHLSRDIVCPAPPAPPAV